MLTLTVKLKAICALLQKKEMRSSHLSVYKGKDQIRNRHKETDYGCRFHEHTKQ